uniref:hypothetical protein n=1 Tax=Staphylococcus saprophyticus TaxID=29385 RepID=UPI001642B48E
MNEVGIVGKKEWYMDSGRSSKLKELGVGGVGGWSWYVDNVRSSGLRVSLSGVCCSGAVEEIMGYLC